MRVRTIPEERLLSMHEQFAGEHAPRSVSFWPVEAAGAIWEQERRKKNIERPVPEWLYFPAGSMGRKNGNGTTIRRWRMPKTQAENSLRSLDDRYRWGTVLEGEAAKKERIIPESDRLGVLLKKTAERGEAGATRGNDPSQIKKECNGIRNQAWHRKAGSNVKEAVQILSKAARCEDGMKDPAYAQEYPPC